MSKNTTPKACDTCKYGNLIGSGDLYCDKFKKLRENYDFNACECYKSEEK